MAKLNSEQIERRAKNTENARLAFSECGGQLYNGYPAIHSEVLQTRKGTYYLQKPGVVLVSRPNVELSGVQKFLDGYDEDLRFGQYLQDPIRLTDATQLVKFAGQTCYASFGPGRTKNLDADAYVDDIKNAEHGSVLEHPNFSFLVYGVSRSLTHELVRHRSGWAFSQLSQRYVSGRVLRFVERAEYVKIPNLHRRFERRIDTLSREYANVSDELLALQISGGSDILSAEAKTDRRKKVQQASRSVLPNETETVLVLTANERALQHTENMRSSEHAETEIRELFFRLFLCSIMTDPTLFADFEIIDYPDGTMGACSPYKKP